MKNMQLILATAAAALTLTLGGIALAQPQGFGGGGGGGGGGRGGGRGGGGMNFQNMDPQQMQQMIQQRINSSYREQMDVTNDDEWALIEGRINAVTQARMATTADSGGLGGLMGMGGMGGGGPGGGGPGGGFRNLFGQPSSEAQALQKAIDDNAPTAQIKTLIARLQAVHQEKLDKLAKAQEDLRAVLTPRQEGIAILGGLLN
jgi:Spy/CpxP family protein refolding chaperone